MSLFAADSPSLLIFTALVLLLAGFVKGVIGLGLPTISVGLLGLIMAPVEAAALLVVPNLVTNVWQLLAGPSVRALVARLWPMMLGVLLGTLAGAQVFPLGAYAWATALLGVALALYAGLGLAAKQWPLKPEQEAWMGPLVGFATGVVTILTGVFVIPAVPYLQALKLEKDNLVQALGLSFLVSTIALALALFGNGLFATAIAGSSLLALAPALGGMLVGQALRSRISAASFRRWFLSGLLLLGAYLVLKALF
ncbi:sulfite exporter TauE/SafE family protein [Ferrovibrio sp.]|uniref:sulfite exporter TauE/SafE family protein n=1 Tax=Ferrovibrio sp. TaxID=1917215 RepID=UPI003D2E3A72